MNMIDRNSHPFSIDVPVCERRSGAIHIEPMMMWCSSVFRREDWRPRNRREVVRFCFRSEDQAAQFAEAWRPRL